MYENIYFHFHLSQVYGTNKASVEGFGGSAPNLGDSPPTLIPSNIEKQPRKSKSGVIFGNSNTSYNEGRELFY